MQLNHAIIFFGSVPLLKVFGFKLQFYIYNRRSQKKKKERKERKDIDVLISFISFFLVVSNTFRLYLDTAYFTKIEKLLLKVL